MADFIDREVLPEEVFGSLGGILFKEIQKASDDESRVGVVNTLLQRALHERGGQNDRLAKLLVSVDGGHAKGRDIAKSLCISERSFRRLWHDVVGIEQRKFASLMRFHRAVSMIDAGCQLAAIAQECGYSDQPHLARDIKMISGLPPSLLRKRLGADVYQDLYSDRPAAPWLSSQ
jgi:AraC-like DNA-binding protein